MGPAAMRASAATPSLGRGMHTYLPNDKKYIHIHLNLAMSEKGTILHPQTSLFTVVACNPYGGYNVKCLQLLLEKAQKQTH